MERLFILENVCGVVKRIIAQHLQKLKRKVFLQPEWEQAIKREVKKVHLNAVMLGFMVEQMVVVKAWEEGMKLSPSETAKLDNALYFETGLECDLKLQEGWTNIASEKVKKYFIWYIRKNEFARANEMVHSEVEDEVKGRNGKLIVRGHTAPFMRLRSLSIWSRVPSFYITDGGDFGKWVQRP